MIYYFPLFLFLIVLGQVIRIYFYHKQFIRNPTSEEDMARGIPLYASDIAIIFSTCFIFCLVEPLIAFIVTLSLSLLFIILGKIYKKRHGLDSLNKIIFTPIWFSIFALFLLLWVNLIFVCLFFLMFNIGLKELLEPYIWSNADSIRLALLYLSSSLILVNIVLEYRKHKLSFPFLYNSLIMFILWVFLFFEM